MINEIKTIEELIIFLDENDIKHESNGENNIIFLCDNHLKYLVRYSDSSYSKTFKRLINIINEWIKDKTHGRS